MTGSRIRQPELRRQHAEGRSVGHRRKQRRSVWSMASPPSLDRRRLGVLAGAVAVSLALGIFSLVAPRGTQASADPSTIQTASLPIVSRSTDRVEDTAAQADAAEATTDQATTESKAVATEDESPSVPADSGSGRRIVFDQSDQRVWLVKDDGTVERSYLVSGSRFDNLKPGTYAVQSKQRHATSYDYTGTMEYFVRFTTGVNAPIGFHSIPKFNNGELEQTLDQLGQPLSAGCIRQEIGNAKFLWDWAPIGTKVVVTA